MLADSLEYTREGLRTRESLALDVGAHNRIVITAPPRLHSVAASHGGFPFDSAFPLPALLSVLLFPHAGNVPDLFTGHRPRAGIYQVFAHAGSQGTDDHSKALTDRRAAVAIALLTCDVDGMLAVAEEESWGLEFQQVMLRLLECDPGPIDGIAEVLTSDAVALFQQRYVAGTFHRGDAPRFPALASTGVLDAETSLALIEAFTLALSPRVPLSSMHPSHPAAGCAGFNPVAVGDDVLNRRISLVVHEQLPPHHDAAPCKQGDASACALFGDAQQRCMWHRLHVRDAPIEEVVHHHFNASWLLLPNGNYLLSTLTTLPDTEDIEFEVHTARQPLDGEVEAPSDLLVSTLGSTMVNKPRHGVAQVVWVPPAGFAPGVDGRLEDGLVPLFRARHPATSTLIHDSWPAHEIAVLFDRSVIDDRFSPHAGTELVLTSEQHAYESTLPSSAAQPYDEHHYILRFEGVPPEGLYSLRVQYADGVVIPVFENVEYERLDRVGDGDEPPAGLGQVEPEDAPLEEGDPDTDAIDPPPRLRLTDTRTSHRFF